ncbi:MAG TPA: hypothetical protein VG826_05335 [Pirellulales bacterium]|nr:hypothetical protein [Pirellulales bacterium]
MTVVFVPAEKSGRQFTIRFNGKELTGLSRGCARTVIRNELDLPVQDIEDMLNEAKLAAMGATP